MVHAVLEWVVTMMVETRVRSQDPLRLDNRRKTISQHRLTDKVKSARSLIKKRDENPKYTVQPGFGNPQWHKAIRHLYDVVRAEPVFDTAGAPVNFKPLKKVNTLNYLTERYIRYVLVFQRLSDCLPRLIHPQKRRLLKNCIESVAGRLCEIKHQMIAFNKLIFHYFDDFLSDLRLTPYNMEIVIPKYMLQERLHVIGMRHQLLAWMISRLETLSDAKIDDLLNPPTISTGSASKVSMREQSEAFVTSASSEENHRYTPDGNCLLLVRNISKSSDVLRKIVRLQCWWRVWLCRQKVNRLREEEFEDLGMTLPKGSSIPDDQDMTEYEEKEKMFEERDEELNKNKFIEYEQFVEHKGLDLAWQMKHNLTQWLLEMRDLQGEFPDYPEDEEGGCSEIFREKTIEEVADELEELLDPTPKKPAPPPPRPKPEKVVVKKDARGKPIIEDPGWTMPQSKTMTRMIRMLNEYNEYWYYKYEADNAFQRFDREMMMEEVRSEAGKIIRTQVDKLMRYELEKLKVTIDDTVYKKTNEKVKKVRSARSRTKRVNDPTGGKTIEELYGELVLMGLVKPVKNVRLKDLLGDFNFQQSAQDNCIPAVPDVRNLMTVLLGLPLSSEFVHASVPLVNAIMLAGPPGTGKTMLVHAICRETGANLIDLSPSNLAGKFVGTIEQNYLKYVALKVGKAMEPTVFYVDECELVYPMKAPPKTEENYARWSAFLLNLIKNIKNGDRMVLIGETHNPFYCKRQLMFNLYKIIIFFPIPDYGSRMAIWKGLLARLPAFKVSTLNLSVLTKMTEGYSARDIQFVVDNVLHPDRIAKKRGVTNEEFLHTLTFMGRPSSDVMEAWLDWYSQTPMIRGYTEWKNAMAELEGDIEQTGN